MWLKILDFLTRLGSYFIAYQWGHSNEKIKEVERDRDEAMREAQKWADSISTDAEFDSRLHTLAEAKRKDGA